jgi:hypothetical protein
MLVPVVGRSGGAVDEFVRRWQHRGRVAEAMVLLTLAAGAQRWVPMRRWSFVLGNVAAVPDSWRGARIDTLPVRSATLVEQRTLRAVHRASRFVWWKPRCLAEATAAQILLRQQGETGVVVIGLRPTDDPSKVWDAHAWLVGRRGAITGGPAASGFTATTVFEVPGGLRASEVALGGGPSTS